MLADGVLAAFLEEDAVARDATTSGLDLPQAAIGEAVAQEAGVASGMGTAARLFALLDPAAQADGAEEGERIAQGDVILTVRAAPAALLGGERVALNLLGRACGVATLTARYSRALADTGVTLLDTRKTMPGLRALDRAAVRAGGGANHRSDLAAMALVKENHACLVGGVGEAVAALKAFGGGQFVEAEVENEAELRAALAAGADRVMLDDWPLESIAGAIALAKAAEAEVEVSGGLTPETMQSVARHGPDFVSSGRITSAAAAFQITFGVRPG